MAECPQRRTIIGNINQDAEGLFNHVNANIRSNKDAE